MESFRASSVSRLVEEETPVAGADSVELAEVEGRDPQRPGGKRFGSLVHELLARSPLAIEPSDVESLGRSLARMLDATDAEVEGAVAAVSRALEHPLLVQARGASECYRETPLVHRDGEGRLVEGIPDLVFRTDVNAPWTIVDFKTDLRIDMSQDPYRRQVAHYIEALEAATNEEAHGILLYV